MILIDEIRQASDTPKIGDSDTQTMLDLVESAAMDFAVRNGEKGLNTEFVKKTVEFIVVDLEKFYRHVNIGEACLAIRSYQPEKYEKFSANMFKGAIDIYINSDARFKYKEEVVKKQNLKMLKVKTPWTISDHVDAMRKRYIENLNNVHQGRGIRDIGGLLFEHLLKLQLIELTEDDEKEVVEAMRQKRRLMPLDVSIRDLLKDYDTGGEKILHEIKNQILYKYFKMEVEMREEAEKIKNSKQPK